MFFVALDGPVGGYGQGEELTGATQTARATATYDSPLICKIIMPTCLKPLVV